jgi:transposase
VYRDPKQWAYIRRLILEKGASRRGVARRTGLSRRTVRKMLASPRPPNKASALIGGEEKLLEATCFLAGRRPSIEPIAYQRRALYLWGRARDLVLKVDRPRGAALLREMAEVISRPADGNELNSRRSYSFSVGVSTRLSRPCVTRSGSKLVRDWLDRLLRGEMRIADLSDLRSIEELPLLIAKINDGTLRQRKKAATILADKRGIPIRTIAASLSISRNSVRRYLRLFVDGGVEALFAGKKRSGGRLAENEQVRKHVFSLLHEPPSVSRINRTAWRMADLTQVLRERGTRVCAQVVREIIRSAGWRWRKARKVLTSTDPEYREKVHYIQSILAQLQGCRPECGWN